MIKFNLIINVSLLRVVYSNKSKINKKLKAHKIDTIVHLAASLGVSKTEKSQTKLLI